MIKIGSVVGNRTVTAMTRQFVLAVSIDNTVPEPWTVWDLDSDGNGVHSGRYFKEQMDAEWDFCSRAFEWFQDNVNINYIEDDEETEEPPAPPKKSCINKDFDEAVDKMVEELAERRNKNKPATEEKNCGTCGDYEFCEAAGRYFGTGVPNMKCCFAWKAKENAPKGSSEQVEIDRMIKEATERKDKGNAPRHDDVIIPLTLGYITIKDLDDAREFSKQLDSLKVKIREKANAPKPEASGQKIDNIDFLKWVMEVFSQKQVTDNLRKKIERYGVPKEVIFDDGTTLYSAKRHNELEFLHAYKAIAEVWTRMLISSNSKVIRTVIKEICQTKNLKGQPYAREIYAAYEEMIYHNFYKH